MINLSILHNPDIDSSNSSSSPSISKKVKKTLSSSSNPQPSHSTDSTTQVILLSPLEMLSSSSYQSKLTPSSQCESVTIGGTENDKNSHQELTNSIFPIDYSEERG